MQTQELLSQELHSLVEGSKGALGFAAIVGLLLALWSASRGMSGLITAINIAYEEKERRGFPQESPHLSDRSKNVGEERLVLQHLGEAMHQRAQPVITHGGQ